MGALAQAMILMRTTENRPAEGNPKAVNGREARVNRAASIAVEVLAVKRRSGRRATARSLTERLKPR